MLHAALPGNLRRYAAIYALRRGPRIHRHHAHLARIMPGTAQTLHCAGYGARTANLENAVDFTDINPKLHGGGGAQKAEFSLSQRLFRFHPLFF